MAAPDRFPIPASGTPIPKGWFARLVAFINSLVLHGDGRFTMVNRSAAGTTVTLTPSLINSLSKSVPAGGGSPIIAATGFPDYASGTPIQVNTSYQVTGGDVWVGGTVTINPNGVGSGGGVQLRISAEAYGTNLFDPVILSSNQSSVELTASFLYPARLGQHIYLFRTGDAVVDAYLFPLTTA